VLAYVVVFSIIGAAFCFSEVERLQKESIPVLSEIADKLFGQPRNTKRKQSIESIERKNRELSLLSEKTRAFTDKIKHYKAFGWSLVPLQKEKRCPRELGRFQNQLIHKPEIL
jgi:hypothetical protein